MISLKMSISGIQAVSRKPSFEDYSISIDASMDDGDALTLRQLISRIVIAEVNAFRGRQKLRSVDRVLSLVQIQSQIQQGKVAPGAADARISRQKVDCDQAIATALQAFEDGLYLVVVDGQEQRHLDAQIHIHDGIRITFIRLVFLAGG